MDIQEIVAQADALEAKARAEGKQVIYDAADAQLVALQGTALPKSGNREMSAMMRDMADQAGSDFRSMPHGIGKTFVETFLKNLKSKLCEDGSELSKLFKAGARATAGAIVAAIVATLAVGPAVAILLVPVAVEIAIVGLDSYCEI